MRHKASGEEGWGQFVDIERAQASKQKRQQQETKRIAKGWKKKKKKRRRETTNSCQACAVLE